VRRERGARARTVRFRLLYTNEIEARMERRGSVSRRSGFGGTTPERSRRATRPGSARARPTASRGREEASWPSAGGPARVSSEERGGVECPIRNAKTERFARGRFARGARAGKRTPGARSRRRTAWRRVIPQTSRVGEKRGSD